MKNSENVEQGLEQIKNTMNGGRSERKRKTTRIISNKRENSPTGERLLKN